MWYYRQSRLIVFSFPDLFGSLQRCRINFAGRGREVNWSCEMSFLQGR